MSSTSASGGAISSGNESSFCFISGSIYGFGNDLNSGGGASYCSGPGAKSGFYFGALGTDAISTTIAAGGGVGTPTD